MTRRRNLSVLILVGSLLGGCTLILGDGGSDAGLDSDLDAEADAELEADVEVEADVEIDVEVEADVEIDVEVEADVEVDIEADAEVEADVEVDAEADADARCVPVECEGGDPCAFDWCDGEGEVSCDYGSPEVALLRLLDVGDGEASFELDLGGPGLSTDRIHCTSTGNASPIIAHDFDNGVVFPFVSDGTVTVSAEAAAGGEGRGVRLCGSGRVRAERLDLTRAAGPVALAFSLRAVSLSAGHFLYAAYSPDGGSHFRVLGLVGDEGPDAGWQRYQVILPQEAQASDDVDIQVRRSGGDDSNCGDLDDLRLVELPPSATVDRRLEATFDRGVLDPFAPLAVESDDLSIIDIHGGRRARLVDNEGTALLAVFSTEGVDPAEELLFAWTWGDTLDSMSSGDYVLAQLSINEGLSWETVAAVGLGQELQAFRRYGVLLPPEAWHRPAVLVRFLAPTTSEADSEEGVLLDDVTVTVEHPASVDRLSAATDAGDGTYRFILRSEAAGARQVECAWLCGGGALVSNRVRVAIP